MNPLALPKETTLRVLLVVVVVVAASLAVAESLWYGLYLDHANEVVRDCLDSADPLRCQRDSEHDRIAWTLAWAPAVVAVAIAGAGLGSMWRRRRLVPYPGADIPAVRELVAGVGGPSYPLLWRPARPVVSARADGLVAPYVEVGPSFAGLALTQPAATTAVLRHEWAHHRGRDIAPSRFAWWSIVALAVVIVPFVISAWDAGAAAAAKGLIRLLAVVALAVLARAAVLRAREVDADLVARAESPDGLRAALRATSPTGPVIAALADHPSAGERLAVVDDARRAFRLRATDAVLVGLTTAVAAPVITRLVRGWFQFGDPAFYAELIGWAVTGALIGAWLAAMMLRAVAACRNAGTELSLALFGVTSAVALVVGGYVLGTPLLLPVRSLPSTVTGVGAAVLLALGLVALAVWLRATVGWWLDAVTARHLRWAAVLVPTVLGAVLGALVLGSLKHVEGLASALDENPEVLGATLDPSEPFTLVSILLSEAELWVIPALAVVAAGVPLVLILVARRVHPTLPMWLRSTSPARPEGDRWDERSVIWRRAIAVGIAAGLFAVACYAIYVAVWDPSGTVAERGWWPAVQVAFASQSIVGAVAGVGAATVALLTGRARATLAGLSGAIAAVIGGVGAWSVQSIDAGEADAALLDDLILDVLAVAVIVAIVAGAVAALLPRPSGRGTARRALAVGAPALAGIALVGGGVAALDAVPSVARDLGHYGQVLEEVTSAEPVAALNACAQGTATPAQQHLLAELRVGLGRNAATPSSPEVRAVHTPLLRALDACVAGNVTTFRHEIGTFLDNARALDLIS